MKQRSHTLREDLGSLALFVVVAEERSFTRAAARLGLSQSALSHAMRRLEAKLGLPLLTRTTRSVAPTQAGERLLETLRPALDDIDERISALTELRERPAGNIRITTSAHAARTILWPAIDRLAASYPDISVELNIEAGFTDIVAERFDAGVRLGQRLEQDMIAMPIGPRLRMATVASPAYLAKHGRKKLNLAAQNDETYKEELGDLLLTILRFARIKKINLDERVRYSIEKVKARKLKPKE